MEVRKLSNRTFSNHSLQNYQQKRCDLCMYHGVIFEQLDRLKEAVMMKNQRIKELEGFIAKISQMAFVKPTIVNQSMNALMQKMNESDQQLDNESSLNSQNGLNSKHFKKKSEESSEISFQDFKLNTGKFEGKINQNSTQLSRRFQRINELNELKKQLQSKISETADKQNNKLSSRIESMNNTQQFDTVRTMSEPYQEGRIGSIAHSSCGTSRLSELSQRKVMFQNTTLPFKIDSDFQFKQSLNKSASFEDKNSISIIKEYVRKLK